MSDLITRLRISAGSLECLAADRIEQLETALSECRHSITPLTYAPNTAEPRHTLPDQMPIPVLPNPVKAPPPRLTNAEIREIQNLAGELRRVPGPGLGLQHSLCIATETAVRKQWAKQFGVNDE